MEFVLFGAREISIKTGNDNIMTTNSAKNLGMIMGNHLKGIQHINKLASSTFVTIQKA